MWDVAYPLVPSRARGPEPGVNGLDVFCLAFQLRPMSGGNTRHSKVFACCAHRFALATSGDAADLIIVTVDEQHWLREAAASGQLASIGNNVRRRSDTMRRRDGSHQS